MRVRKNDALTALDAGVRITSVSVGLAGAGALVAVAAMIVSLLSCSKVSLTALETAADQAAAQGCELIFLPTDPTLAPLCVAVADVVAAGAALGLDLLAPAAGDAGAPAARALVVRDPAAEARVYAWLVAHGAVRLGG